MGHSVIAPVFGDIIDVSQGFAKAKQFYQFLYFLKGGQIMPTFNQLVRKGRQVSEKKAKAPALLKGWNSKKRVAIDQSSPQKRGVCTAMHHIREHRMQA